MCLAIPPIAAAGLSAASSVIGYIGQSQQANQQQAYNNAIYAQQSQQAIDEANYQNRQVERNNAFMLENRENAVRALQADRLALVEQERQESVATALDIENQRIERLKAQGALQSSDKAGLVLEVLLADYDRQFAINSGVMSQNLAFSSGQRVREQAKLTTTANSRIAQARPYEAAPFREPAPIQQVSRPSLLGTVIGAGTSAANAYQSRQYYDSSTGRYRIDRSKSLPSSLPQATPGQLWVNDARRRFNNSNGLN